LNAMSHALAVDVLMKAHVKTTVNLASSSVIYVPTVSVHNVIPTKHVLTDFVAKTLSTMEQYVNVIQALFAIP